MTPEAPVKTQLSAPATVNSKDRGRPIADLVERIEHSNPKLAASKGLSSAALRAGDLVRTMRKEARLSQTQLADNLGVKQSRISEIEAGVGTQGPTLDLMERIAKACGKTLQITAIAEPMFAAS